MFCLRLTYNIIENERPLHSHGHDLGRSLILYSLVLRDLICPSAASSLASLPVLSTRQYFSNRAGHPGLLPMYYRAYRPHLGHGM